MFARLITTAALLAAAGLQDVAAPQDKTGPQNQTAPHDKTGPQDRTAPRLATFRNYGRTFQLELPEGWRQLAPNDALRISENPAAPRNLRRASPRRFYAIGPVDAWLEGNFSSPWLYAVEQPDQWYIDDDFADQLRQSWRRETAVSGIEHTLEDIHLAQVGSQQVECIVARRTSRNSPEGTAEAVALRSLDVHAPSGTQQITLSFTCRNDDFPGWEPEFQRWLATLTFARPPKERATLSERLWTPLVTGAIVGIVLLMLYRHTRGRR